MGVGQLLVLVGSAILVIGPKELPVVARKLGYALGRGVTMLRAGRTALRDAAKDPEIEKMSQDVAKGLEDIRRIRTEITALSATQAVPYALAKAITPPELPLQPPQHHTISSGAVAPPQSASIAASAMAMPAVVARIYSPTHTDKLESGADGLGELIQQSEMARQWARQNETASKHT